MLKPPRDVPFEAHIQDALSELERAGLMRHPRALDSPQGPEIVIDRRSVINLCSNDYLGLAADPRLADAATQALHQWRLGSGASRHIAGTLRPHLDAERALADFTGQPTALLFGSGYAANLGSIQALVGPGDVIFSDALNHASLIDGCRLSRADVVVFPHRDLGALDVVLAGQRHRHRCALIITESLFSMDGDEAPLAALRGLADRHDAGLFVDEAHALGVLGPAGRGLCAEAEVVPDLLVGTLGKAFGLSGAFCAGAVATVRLVQNRARSFVFSTAPPPALAAAAGVAVTLAADADGRRSRALDNASRLRHGLSHLGFPIAPGRAPIIPLHVGDPVETMQLSSHLLDRGVFVHGVRPPTVPTHTSRLRITATAAHSGRHIERALQAFSEAKIVSHVR